MPQADIGKLAAIAQDHSQSEDDRTTAIHAMGRLPAEESIPHLITLMRDDALSIRWVAAATLRKYGREMLEPLLRALATQPADHRFYESAHHALTRFGNPAIEEILAPVLDALTQSGAASAVPGVAMEALEKLKTA